MDGTDPEYLGRMAENCKKVIGDSTYFFALGGAMRTGWIKQEEGWYYTDASGSVGWKNIGGAWYYLDNANAEYPGLMAADGKKVIGNQTYFFGETGRMLTGWVLRPEGWYYANGSGAQVNGWIQVGANWYYLDPAHEEYPGLMLSLIHI